MLTIAYLVVLGAAPKAVPAAGASPKVQSPPAVTAPRADTTGTTASPAPAAASTATTADAVSRGDYDVRLRDLEERVNQLKEKIFQSKARLMQLQEVVLHGTVSGAKVVLIHRNEMGSSFRLSVVQYALDGAMILNRVDSGAGELEQAAEIEVYSGGVAPGNHQLSIHVEYQGYGYGIFSYLKAYRFKINSSYMFTAEEGKVTTIRVVGYEKGGITTELKDRPAMRYDVDVARDLRANDMATPGSNNPRAAPVRAPN